MSNRHDASLSLARESERASKSRLEWDRRGLLAGDRPTVERRWLMAWKLYGSLSRPDSRRSDPQRGRPDPRSAWEIRKRLVRYVREVADDRFERTTEIAGWHACSQARRPSQAACRAARKQGTAPVRTVPIPQALTLLT